MMTHFKTVYVLPHSHFDYGYTHPQRMLRELQHDYLAEAIELCDRYRTEEDGITFKWTVEANHILVDWLNDASEDDVTRLKKLLQSGHISISALPFHTTPLCDSAELWDSLRNISLIEEKLDYHIKTAVNHDVNGQPWSLVQFLNQHGVDFYLTGINVHFGGIPFERPDTFLWEGTDGSRLRCFLGEHYAMFSFFAKNEAVGSLVHHGASDEEIYQTMRSGLEKYEGILAKRAWKHDYYVLTAANPPLYDNNSPDTHLVDACRAYNRVSQDQKIQLITLDELRLLSLKNDDEHSLPIRRGDWTDYWNFGAGSTPQEIKIHKRTSTMLKAIDALNVVQLPNQMSKRHQRILSDVRHKQLIHSEHTWGAAESISQPNSDMTKSMRTHKDAFAWDASSLAAYLLGERLESWAGGPGNFPIFNDNLSIAVFNPTAEKVTQILSPDTVSSAEKGSTQERMSLSALRTKNQLRYDATGQGFEQWLESRRGQVITLAPFSHAVISRSSLAQNTGIFEYQNRKLKTPYYEATWSEQGFLDHLIETDSGKEYVAANSEVPFGAVVRERLATSEKQSRKAFFDSVYEEKYYLNSNWNHDWGRDKTVLGSAFLPTIKTFSSDDLFQVGIEWPQYGDEPCVRLMYLFYKDSPYIDIEFSMEVEGQVEPEGYYISFPVNLGSEWKGYFDTAGAVVVLDDDQIGSVSKDWITMDSFYAVADSSGGMTIASTDIPLLQPSGFGFGKGHHSITRDEHPLVLGWLSNNYWETNFSAVVHGLIGGRYTLSPFKAFKPKEALQAGLHSRKPLVETVICDNPITADPGFVFEGVDVFIESLWEDDGAINIRLRNLSLSQSSQFRLGCDPSWASKLGLKTLRRFDLSATKYATVTSEDSSIRGSIEPGGLMTLCVSRS